MPIQIVGVKSVYFFENLFNVWLPGDILWDNRIIVPCEIADPLIAREGTERV